MAAKPSTAAEKALQKIQDQVTCAICLEPYKQPRLLKCFHVFCEQCLQPMAQRERGQSLSCPTCRKVTPLPEGGVAQLQGAFYIHYLFDIQDALQKVSSSDQPMCNMCKKREASGFCRTCGFVCQRCTEFHQEWDMLKSHLLIDLDTLTGDVTTLVPPLKKTIFCPKHKEKEADLFCETCDQLICRDCIVRSHRDHHYDLVAESFAKQDQVIVDSLKPVEQQIAALETAIQSVDVRSAEVKEQKKTVVAEVHTAIAHLQQALEMRGRELVGLAEQTEKQKLKTLTAQRDGLELQLGERRSCRDFVKESRHTCNQSEILKMKSPVVKQVDDLANSFKPETLALAEQADMKFAHRLTELVKTYQQFGEVYCSPVYPEKCRVSGKGIEKVATRGQSMSVSVEALDRDGEAYLRPVDSLRCELVASDGSSRVRATVKRRDQNIYDISYQPETTGEHQLHILIEEQPILNSPFTVNVLPNFTTPLNIIGDLKKLWGIAITEKEEMVLTEHDGHCVSIISCNGEKKSFGSYGSAPGQFLCPRGVAIDRGGNILVVDYGNHRIQQFSSTGKHIRTVGSRGSGPLQFQDPVGIAVHPLTHKVYVADTNNHRVQVLNSDLTYSSSFGRRGSTNGEFNQLYDIAMDREGNVYVADYGNHRIQVFTDNGVYLRQFGKKAGGGGELNGPVGIAIDSNKTVYVGEFGNNQISIFSTNGEFITSYGSRGSNPGQFSSPFGLAVDKKGRIYECDWDNNRVQIFY